MFKTQTEGFAGDDLRKIFRECQRVAKLPNGVEIYSEREREFTIAKNYYRVRYSGFRETTDASSPLTTSYITSYMTSRMTSESSSSEQQTLKQSTTTLFKHVITTSGYDTSVPTTGESTAVVTSPLLRETTSGSTMTSAEPPSPSTLSAVQSAILTNTAPNQRK